LGLILLSTRVFLARGLLIDLFILGSVSAVLCSKLLNKMISLLSDLLCCHFRLTIEPERLKIILVFFLFLILVLVDLTKLF
jgi:hypothetical protein